MAQQKVKLSDKTANITLNRTTCPNNSVTMTTMIKEYFYTTKEETSYGKPIIATIMKSVCLETPVKVEQAICAKKETRDQVCSTCCSCVKKMTKATNTSDLSCCCSESCSSCCDH